MNTPGLLELPERAIRTFERQTRTQVVVHDLGGSLRVFLPPERFMHHTPCCAAVKQRHDWACHDFEITRLRDELPRFVEGRYHRCHAGFVEWVVPVFLEGRLAWVLFAGQRRAKGTFQHLVADTRRTRGLEPAAARLEEIDETDSEHLLEMLRQLRSRLVEWHRQASSLLRHAGASAAGGLRDLAERRRSIEAFLHENHGGAARLSDLAKALKLSESRASHAVREIFGESYVDLLTELRLRSAAALLRDSALPVTEVCLNSGFRDLSHFYRCFRKRFSMTPYRYRRASRN